MFTDSGGLLPKGDMGTYTLPKGSAISPLLSLLVSDPDNKCTMFKPVLGIKSMSLNEEIKNHSEYPGNWASSAAYKEIQKRLT